MKLYFTDPQELATAQCRVVAFMTGTKVKYMPVNDGFKGTPEFKNVAVTDKLPLLVTEEGGLQNSGAICKYFCALAGNKFLGSNAIQRSQVDQWMSFNNSTLAPLATAVNNGIFGWADITQEEYTNAQKDLKKSIQTINTALDGKKFLLGDEVSVADVVLAHTLMYNFQTALDNGFRKSCKNVEAWATACYSLPEMVKVHGNIAMAAKSLKPKVVAEKKDEPKKKQQQAAKPKEEPKKKEEKPKDNVESLPPSSFDKNELYNFKTFFVNHADKKGAAIDELYKILDWDGWAFWRFEYDILPKEGEKEHIANNLMNGFLSRAEHTNKYCFARHCVLGEEPKLQIIGVWMCRGTEIPDGLAKEHAQFEYYKPRKLDPRGNAEDDKLLRNYWGGNPGDVIDGTLKAVTMKWFK